MRFGLILAINARMLIGCGLLMLIPAMLDIFYQHNIVNAFILSSGLTVSVGMLLYFLTPKTQDSLHPKEMFITTTVMCPGSTCG